MEHMAHRISTLFAAGASAAALCIPALAFGQAAPAQCPMVFDYETDAAGNPIVAGQDLTSAYSAWGADLVVWNSQNMSTTGLGIAFDSSNPTGGDWDLGTPNQAYGGPGVGSGGASNTLPLGNLLISAENFVDANGDGLIDVPDDDASGAWFEYFFDAPTCIFSVTNVDGGDGTANPDLIAYDANGSQIEWINIPGVGDNGVVTSTFQVCGVDHIMYDIYGSGALDNLVLCVGGTEEVCDGLDNDGDGEVDEGFDAVQAAQSDQYGQYADGVAVWLFGLGNFIFDPDGTFEEDATAGTATITGTLRKTNDPNKTFDISGTFTGRTTVAGAGSPKLELISSAYTSNGGPVDPSSWYYYTSFSAQLTGTGDYAGGVVNVSPRGPNFQVGDGANGKNAGPGASGWLNWITVSQPNSGSWATNGTGDYNWTLIETCGTEICDGLDNDGDGSIDEGFDVDGDGWTSCGGDCDDNNPNTNPDCPDVCNGVDDDCDGSIDEDFDQDGDGYTTCNGDCDDTDAAINPGATEVCDGVDNDCDGTVDEGFDQDNDGWTTCGGDCDDNNPGANPDCPDICNGIDDDCDGSIDEDFDQDGDGYTTCGGDCDDTNAAINPGATEVCNGIDDNCDSLIDPGMATTYYADSDGDGFGDENGGDPFCTQPPTHVLDNTDCDDSSINIRPGLPFEVCGNSDDENCDGVLDDLGDATVLLSDGTLDHTDYWVLATNDLVNIDDDGDGYIDVQYLRSDLERRFSCDPLAVPWFDARDFGDCDDGNGAVHPYADEICDDLDNDCDGAVDADDGNVMFQGSSVDVHLDLDRDGARSNQIVDEVCPDATVPVGFVLFDGAVDVDCDDGDAERSPLLSEVCDGIDNNCDPTDDFLEDDTDGDGFLACDPSECDDNDDASNGETLWFYPDEDADGYVGAFTDVVASCTQPPDSPLPWARELGDCDDTLASFSPGATEVCDGLDNDCDGQVPPEESDNDGDGEGACTDCDDSDPQRSNLFAELCDGIDTDCDGFIDPDLEVDDDGDNFVECDDWVGDIAGIDGGDCNDSAAILFPGQSVYVTTGFGNPDFTDIQTAIDTVCDDAFIAVEDGEGTFSEFVLPSDKVVHIAGIGPFPIRIVGGSTTAILADGTPPGTTIENLEPETDDGYGLVVTNGAVLDAIDIEVDQFSGAYQGMSVSNGSDVQCTNCVFEDTTASSGSAVLVDGSTVALYDSEITGSTNTDNGAVHAINGSSLTIENTSFTDNAISGTNVKSSGITVSGGQMVLKQTTFHDHTADDRQPTVLVNLGADASFEDVKLVDNAGGIWVETNGTVDFTRLTMLRNGGLDVSTNLEGAIEIRTNTADVTVENGLFADNDGPGINVRNGSSVEVDYSTFVGNGFAGIAQTSGTVEVQYSVFRAQDDDIDGPVTNAFPNNPLENWYQHSSSLTDDCALVAPAVCYTGDPEFFTFHPEIPSDRWLLRPREFGPLWNGAGNIFGAGDVADIIGHAGGPEGDALTWYDDTEGAGTGDGLYDGWEFFWYGDLTTDQGTISSDEDGDNLYGFDEFALGTSPIHADTDQDGPDDHCEAFAAMPESDPVNPNDTTTFQCQ